MTPETCHYITFFVSFYWLIISSGATVFDWVVGTLRVPQQADTIATIFDSRAILFMYLKKQPSLCRTCSAVAHNPIYYKFFYPSIMNSNVPLPGIHTEISDTPEFMIDKWCSLPADSHENMEDGIHIPPNPLIRLVRCNLPIEPDSIKDHTQSQIWPTFCSVLFELGYHDQWQDCNCKLLIWLEIPC